MADPNYNIYPAVDVDGNFPPRIRDALIASPELSLHISEEVANDLGADPTIRQAAVQAATPAVQAEIVKNNLVPGYPNDTTDWRWFLAYDTGEVAFGQRSDGSLYPDSLNTAGYVGLLDESQGWRFAVYYASGEVLIGQRADGTWFPDSLGGGGTTVQGVRISGDSITANWASNDNLASLRTSLGAKFDVVGEGDGGKTSDWIAARQGGQPLRITASGNVIPASGAVDVTVSIWNHIGTRPSTMTVGQYAGVLAGIAGTLRINDASTGAGTFTRNFVGRPVPLPAMTPFTRDQYRKYWQISWAGRNNYGQQSDTDQIVRDTRDILNHAIDKEHALVYSILPWVGEEIGKEVRTRLDSTNAALADNFPTKFVDIAAQLRSTDLITAVGGTPTATDIQNIADGLTPESFRGDSGHPNKLGYVALNLLTFEIYKARGWVS